MEEPMFCKLTHLGAVILLLLFSVTTAVGDPAAAPLTNYPFFTGAETSSAPAVYPPYVSINPDNTDDVVGSTQVIGTTWYDLQHNGTTGRMVEIDDDGYLHFVWMNGTNTGATDRHIYYNAIDPSGLQLWPNTGAPVESSVRAGYVNVDVAFGGIAFPAFHEDFQGSEAFHTAVGQDFGPHLGAFLISEPDARFEQGIDMKIIWPRIRIDLDGDIHVMSQHNPIPDFASANGTPAKMFYTIGEYDAINYTVNFPPDPDTWTEIDWSQTIAYDLDTSPVSDRIAFAWTACKVPGYPGAMYDTTYTQWDNDIQVMIDDDGEDFHFDMGFNLTQFHVPNLAWLPDTIMAEMDTLRAYTDMSVLIDNEDWVHIVFTTPSYFDLEGFRWIHPSIIWHWSEQFPGEFQAIHYAFDDWTWNGTDCGAWNVKAQRPSLGQDPETGYLYCSYQVYDCDTLALSAAGWPSGEVYVSMSTDGGMNWSEGINVTNTITPENAPSGQCLSELCPTMCEDVDGTLHILYVLDRDAGCVISNPPEGGWTLNDVVYQSIPVDLIPSTPLVPQWPEEGAYPFHVEHGPAVGIPGAGRYDVASQFNLAQNYPNPFNPTTTITFSLDQVSDLTLRVYDLQGKEVATVADGMYGSGQHSIQFDASALSSGMYFYKLETAGGSMVKKMLLLR